MSVSNNVTIRRKIIGILVIICCIGAIVLIGLLLFPNNSTPNTKSHISHPTVKPTTKPTRNFQVTDPNFEEKQTLFWAENANRNCYAKPYPKAPHEQKAKNVNGKLIIIYRPNHSIAHAIRQGLQVKDIIKVLKTIELSRLTKAGQNLALYVRQKLKEENFKYKLELISLYYRSGREGEMSPSTNLKEYTPSAYKSAKNFAVAANHEPNLFNNSSEINLFYKSMISEYVQTNLRNDTTSEINYVYQLSHAAHMIDLVRLKQVSLHNWKVKDSFFHDSISQIIGFKDSNDKCVLELISRGYNYVGRSGDLRYRSHGYNSYTYDYFTLHQNITKMTSILYQVYNQDIVC